MTKALQKKNAKKWWELEGNYKPSNTGRADSTLRRGDVPGVEELCDTGGGPGEGEGCVVNLKMCQFENEARFKLEINLLREGSLIFNPQIFKSSKYLTRWIVNSTSLPNDVLYSDSGNSANSASA
ncbi:MAG: hypothetical protein WDN75_21475 [Bacteroidota bacterium]